MFVPFKYSEDLKYGQLDFEWSKRGLFANGQDFKWDLKLGPRRSDYNCSSF